MSAMSATEGAASSSSASLSVPAGAPIAAHLARPCRFSVGAVMCQKIERILGRMEVECFDATSDRPTPDAPPNGLTPGGPTPGVTPDVAPDARNY